MELYYLLLLTSLIIGTYLTNRFGAKVFQLNFASWYYGFEFITMSAISAFLILRIKDTNWALSYIPQNEFPHKEVILTLSWCAIAIPLDFIIANQTGKKLNLQTLNLETFIDKASQSNNKTRLILIGWLFIILGYTLFVVYKIGSIPQLLFLTGDFEVISKTRGLLTHRFPASNHLKELLGMHISMILCYSSLNYFLKRKNLLNFVIFISYLVFTTFYLTLNLNKSGLALLFIGVIITFAATYKLNIKKIFISGIACFLLVVLFFSAVNNLNLKSSVQNTWSRLVYAQSYGNYMSFYIFPKEHSHIGFNSISKQVKKLGISYTEPASRIMMKKAAPKKVKEGTAGFMVSAFFAEAWANWGVVGLIFSPLFVGFFIKALVLFIINLPKTPISIGLLVFVSHRLGVNMGMNQFVFPRYIIVSILLIFISVKIIDKIEIFYLKNQGNKN